MVLYKRKYIEDFLIYFISSFSTNENELQTVWYRTNNSKEKKAIQDMEELSVSDSKESVPGQKEILPENKRHERTVCSKKVDSINYNLFNFI